MMIETCAETHGETCEDDEFRVSFSLQGTANMTHDKIMTGSSAGILPPRICRQFPTFLPLHSFLVAWSIPMSIPMSHDLPKLLGKGVKGLIGKPPKGEGEAHQHQPCQSVDIEGSPSPVVTRVAQGESCPKNSRPSWSWRCFQSVIALLLVIFSTWLLIALSCQGCWDDIPKYKHIWELGIDGVIESKRIEVGLSKGLSHDLSFLALMVSTGLAGLAAMWLYLIAPTAHILLAAHFLCLNWLEGLVTLSLVVGAHSTPFFLDDGSPYVVGRLWLEGLTLLRLGIKTGNSGCHDRFRN